MSLSPATAALAIKSAYFDAASLDANGKPSGALSVGNFFEAFANAYNEYASQGVVLGANNTGGDATILANFLSSQTLPVNANFTLQFATALASFWAGVAVEPDEPKHGGSAVAAVTNDAATKVSAFAAAISQSITATDTVPYYEAFVRNIEAVVKTIVWTVTELTGPDNTPTLFVEAIA